MEGRPPCRPKSLDGTAPVPPWSTLPQLSVILSTLVPKLQFGNALVGEAPASSHVLRFGHSHFPRSLHSAFRIPHSAPNFRLPSSDLRPQFAAVQQQILGLQFFDGTVAAAVDRALEHRGLIVAPSGTCFRRLQRDEVYRRAMTHADLILPDSGFMVLLWRLLRGKRIQRISGLAYLNDLLGRETFRRDRSIVWVLPDERARDIALVWLQNHGYLITADDCYVAPIYGTRVEDPALLERVRARKASHVVIALSGGVQEKLGVYLREKCLLSADLRPPTSDLSSPSCRPAIHCIGAALGFVTGYQVAIPKWADRLYLGWLIRLLTNPRRFFPRAMSALALPGMILKYGGRLPPMKR